MQQWWWCCSTLGQRWWHYRAVSILLFRTVSGNSPGVQVLSYYTLEVVTGLMMVQGQLVTVKVVA